MQEQTIQPLLLNNENTVTTSALTGISPAKLMKKMNHKEKTIKLYGWIAESIKKDLSIPLENNYEYARASSIELILTNPDLYNKIIHWD